MRYYYGIIFKGDRIMKIKKWLGVAALATVAGLALAACGNSEKKADNATTIKIATVNRSGSEEMCIRDRHNGNYIISVK